MVAGELFINLGIKGSDKTVGALTEVKKGLGEAASMSLEAKAGILAAIYALERLTATSGAAGTGFTNFAALTGVSAKTLQQYQNAARQVAVSNESITGSFKGLQSAMTKVLTGEGLPKYAALVAQTLGDQSLLDPAAYQEHPEKLFDKLQEYAQKEKNIGLRNAVLNSFGIGDDVIAGMARGGFGNEALTRAAKFPSYNPSEIRALTEADRAWRNLGKTIEIAFGRFNAAHGVQLVQDISKITAGVLKLVEAFTKLSEKLHVFEAIEGATKTLASVLDFIAGPGNDDKKQQAFKEAMGLDTSGKKTNWGALFGTPDKPYEGLGILPTVSPNQQSNSSQNIEVNQTLQFQHDGRDHSRTSDSVKQAVKQSYRQMSAQLQGT